MRKLCLFSNFEFKATLLDWLLNKWSTQSLNLRGKYLGMRLPFTCIGFCGSMKYVFTKLFFVQPVFVRSSGNILDMYYLNSRGIGASQIWHEWVSDSNLIRLTSILTGVFLGMDSASDTVGEACFCCRGCWNFCFQVW